jgi:hypothetical protein
VIQALPEAGETDELRHDAPERRILQIRDGEVAGVMNLGNMYSNYRRLPRARRPEFLRASVRTTLTRHKALSAEFEDLLKSSRRHTLVGTIRLRYPHSMRVCILRYGGSDRVSHRR